MLPLGCGARNDDGEEVAREPPWLGIGTTFSKTIFLRKMESSVLDLWRVTFIWGCLARCWKCGLRKVCSYRCWNIKGIVEARIDQTIRGNVFLF